MPTARPSKLPAGDRRSLLALAALLALNLAVGALAGAVTRPAVASWYPTLHKPGFTPPDWLFAPVWTVLYLAMAVAAWRVWRVLGDSTPRRLALRAYSAQLLLNFLWSFAFFGAHSPLAGLLVIAALAAAILWTIAAFRRLDRVAALLLLPYLAWVAYAALLNGAIWRLNG